MRRLANTIGAVEAVLLVVLTVYSITDKGLSVELLFVLFLASAAGTGWLVASRVPANPIGWLLLFVAGCFLVSAPFHGLAVALADSAPAVAAWAFWLAGTGDWGWIWLPPIGVMGTVLLLLFPDGHLRKHRLVGHPVPARRRDRARADPVGGVGCRHRRVRVCRLLRRGDLGLGRQPGRRDVRPHPDLDRHRGPALPPLRDRPDHQPHGLLCAGHRRAGAGVRLRRHPAEPAGPGVVEPRGGRGHPDRGRTPPPAAVTHS